MKRTELKRGGPPKRKTRLAAESKRRKAQRRARQEVVAETKAKFGVCQAMMMRDADGNRMCLGPMDVHEVVKRSAHRDAHLDKRLTITLCRFHNGWVESNSDQACRLGLNVKRWAWERHGEDALKEASRLRTKMFLEAGFQGEDPFWW